MSTSKDDKSDESGRVERPPAQPWRPTGPKTSSADEANPKPKGLKYEFKIAPADPKNSFDFEDVADK